MMKPAVLVLSVHGDNASPLTCVFPSSDSSVDKLPRLGPPKLSFVVDLYEVVQPWNKQCYSKRGWDQSMGLTL